MKNFFRYIDYFFFHAIHWDPVLASFLLYYTLRGEKKYGIDTFHASELDRYTIEKGEKEKSSRYEAINYFILEKLLENCRRMFPGEKNLLDAGCGKGRVLVAAAHYGFTKITGVDFAKELCEEAENNMKKIKIKFPGIDTRIICDDILNYEFRGDETVFFLFNPFNQEILEKFVENVELSVKKFPRTIHFLYASPKHLHVLEEKKFTIPYRVKKMKWLEGVIAVKSPSFV